MVMYADDSSLIITADTLQQLEQKCQTTMIKLNKYLSSNNLFLNEKKTVYMVFDNIDIHISYNNIQIKKVDKFKLLGVTLDNCFKFDTHTCTILLGKLIHYMDFLVILHVRKYRIKLKC